MRGVRTQEHFANVGTPWSYALAGMDWQGQDSLNSSWTCMTGTKQSPVNVPSAAGAGPPCTPPRAFDAWLHAWEAVAVHKPPTSPRHSHWHHVHTG